jgi:hypothetical protein
VDSTLAARQPRVLHANVKSAPLATKATRENFSRTAGIAFHCRGTTSSVSEMCSPNKRALHPRLQRALLNQAALLQERIASAISDQKAA